MEVLYKSIYNELDKIFHRKKNIAFLALSIALILGLGILISFGEKRLALFAVTASNYPIFVLNLFTSALLPIFIFSITTDLFSGEIGDKTMKTNLTRPISRFKVYLSKIFSTGIYTLITLCVLLICSVLSASILVTGSFGPEALGDTLMAFFVALVPMTFLTITAAFMNQFFSNSGSALATLIITYIGAKVLVLVFPILGKISPFSLTDWHMLWIGNQLIADKIIIGFSILLGSSLILLAVGYVMFDRRDI